MKFLRNKEDQLEQISQGWKKDRFDDFGAFVASELRSKSASEVSIYMQQICNVLYAQIAFSES